MAFLNSVIRSKIFNEFTEEERKKYFSITAKKIIHNIDTFYFSVSLLKDTKDNKNDDINYFIEMLEMFKSIAEAENDLIEINLEEDLYYKNMSFGFYKYCITKQGLFDIFICNRLPNENTPRILVQVRSSYLWALGARDCINSIYKTLTNIFTVFNIDINEIKENRIDYCYHTNAVQNPDKYFTDEFVKNNIYTTFKIGSKVFRKEGKNLNVEYLSLGNRKSNNIFFRCYNKSREVCELAYKDFFLDVWKAYGLISEYDYFIYNYCYQNKSYDKIAVAKLEFYLKFGKDEKLKLQCKSLLLNPNVTMDRVRKFTKNLCPNPTLIMNFEFQTMRKFYYSAYDLINYLPITHECEPVLLRLFQILDNRKIFLDYLLIKCVCFQKMDIDINTAGFDPKEFMCDFWYRIYKLKLDAGCQVIYTRKYKNNNNIKFILNRIKSSLASYSIYKNNNDTDMIQDLSALICDLNDNDIKELERYNKIKEKKKKAQKTIKHFKTFIND